MGRHSDKWAAVLMIAAMLAVAACGNEKAENASGGGSVFWFTVPAAITARGGGR